MNLMKRLVELMASAQLTNKETTMFGLNNIVKKFNNLQKEVEAYLVQQQAQVNKLEDDLILARQDKAVAENIKAALAKINGGE